KQLITRLVPTFKIHQTQVEEIRKFIEDSPYPVILAGDFNAVPNSWEYYHLGQNLQDAFMKVGNGSATSFHDYKIPIRIDYIFASEKLKPITYEVKCDIKTSDHFPVIATFDFK
ncbi:MAG: endonuclease/exonuclease/phosphatase family protein, partial [Cruoricaptor ignavus]|nr:endonuclease/exonuclease/phosphatase family protein [Cruoricaptor ignavus]